jgi:hypothetical protein
MKANSRAEYEQIMAPFSRIEDIKLSDEGNLWDRFWLRTALSCVTFIVLLLTLFWKRSG